MKLRRVGSTVGTYADPNNYYMKTSIFGPWQVVALSAAFLTIANIPRAKAADTAPTPAEATARIEAARAEVENVRSNIFVTLVELDKMRGKSGTTDPQFQVFTNQLACMQEHAKALSDRAAAMQEKGRGYFADWEAKNAAIQDAGARRDAEQKLKSRKSSYDSINRNMQEARKQFKPFLQSLNEIKDICQRQVTDSSRAQAKDLFMQANWRCMDVQRALMEIEKELDSLLGPAASQ